MNKILKLALALSVFLMAHTVIQAQDVDRLLYRADKLFSIQNYDDALKSYLEALESGQADLLTNYRVGVCYANFPNVDQQLKGIPYLEKAIKNKTDKVPDDVHFHIGNMYRKNLQIAEAIAAFSEYKRLLPESEKSKIAEVDALLEQCYTAQSFINDPKDTKIENMGHLVNSEHTEYNPVVSADEGVIAYTALRPERKGSSSLIEKVMVTYKTGGGRTEPTLLEINTQNSVGTAGISADGQQMLIFIGGVNNSGSIYSVDRQGSDWGTPTPLKPVNSDNMESTASITPDGKTIYFASNRPGGLGGMDIWYVKKDGNGKWGYPKNLGRPVNTAADEDAPFIHPDQRTLFFTSDREGTMGGKDIFKANIIGGKWREPENMGYPINTPANDNYFTLTADGRRGYFSSDRKGGYGAQDIYTFDMPEGEANIPLTLVKGRILAGEDKEPVPTKILVVDNETSEKVDFVYNPDPKTGDYLIIFPPGKNYDMIIESEGYMPYTVNINVPNQDYFYELYQQIYLKPIKQFDVVVGQEVEVKNAFYDTGVDTGAKDVKKHNEAALVQNDSVDLYDLMDAIIASEDSAAYDYLLDLMFDTNPIDHVNFDNVENEDLEAAKREYYYDESDTSNLVSREVEGQTIFSLPTFHVTEEAKKQKEEAKKKEPKKKYDPAILEEVHKVYFDVGKSDLDDQYKPELSKVLDMLKQYDRLGIEISGYASAEGDDELNRQLSNERAKEVLNFFNFKGVVRRRVKAKGYGAKATEGNKEEARRVEVRIVDLYEYKE